MIRAALLATLCIAAAACATRPIAPPGVAASQVASGGPPEAAPSPLAPGPLAPRPLAPSARAFVQSATAMLGQPYRFGGTEPGGFDCSGLVVYAAKSAGFALPRMAQGQLAAGVGVARDEVRPGDLVFMHLSSKELHVGISVDHSRFVHAPASGGRVRIDSLDTPPYSRGFLTARRIVFSP